MWVEPSCMDATQLGVLDWIRLRTLLAEYRNGKAGKRWDVGELAREIHVEESTIYRIENIKTDEKYQPKLATIVAWLEMTAPAVTLSSFFEQIALAPTAPPVQQAAAPSEETPTITRAEFDRFRQDLEARFRKETADIMRSVGRATRRLVDRQREALAEARRLAPGAGDRGSRARGTHQGDARGDPRRIKAVSK